MKFSISWLKKHLETEASLDQIVEAMIAAGLEVEHVDDPKARLAPFTIAHVLEAEQHPDADRLRVCKVETVDGEKQIVCGAPNARAGIKVAYAAVGTYVPGIDLTLTKAKIRGVESLGMMCSARELQLGDDHDGIIEAPQDAPVGQPVADALGADDAVIDFEVTPNRPDWLGVSGIARDLAAAGLGTLVSPEVEPVAGDYPCPQEVRLSFSDDTKSACSYFTGRLVRGVKNGPSPQWLQDALVAIGLRPINALVDITNYITFDRGRPLHVYDYDKIKGAMNVRLAEKGETLLALDGKEYQFDETICIIEDEERVIDLGGVMGGESTGCSEETVNVFIESAYFDPLRTAKTGRKLNIISDARYRFERGVDRGFVRAGLDLCTKMVLDLCGGEASEPTLVGEPPAFPKSFAFKLDQVKRLTGIEVGESEAKRILADLGCDVAGSGAEWTVTPPSFRADLVESADLVEEISRLVGFDKLPTATLPRLNAVEAPKFTPAQNRVRLAKRALAGAGYLEAVTWSFCEASHAELFGGGGEAVQLANPISSELGVMRPSILPGLIAALQRNADRAREDLALFEVGPQYAGDRPEDQAIVAAGARRSAPPRHWDGADAPADLFTVKGDVLAALEGVGAPVASLKTSATAPGYFHPGRSGALGLGPKNALAYFGEIHPRVLKAMDVEGPVLAFEILLDNIPTSKPKATKSKPALGASDLNPVTRDFAFIVADGVAAEELARAAKGADKKLITGARVFDRYIGAGVPEGQKSLAIEVTLQPRTATLTDDEIKAVSDKIVAQVKKAVGGELRG